MYIIGYDLGSSSAKAAIVDADSGSIVAQAHYPNSEAPIKSLQPGWAEQSPEHWWQYIKEATKAVMAKAPEVKPADIKAIGISYQMHGVVIIDKEGRPLRDAIIWCDSRGVPYGEKAMADLGPQLCLGSILNSPGNFTATKLAWVKENEPHIFEKIYKVMLPGDYIAYRLTGNILTTAEGMSEYMLWDFKNNSLADFLLEYFGYDSSIFPTIVPTFSNQGRLTPEAAQELGLDPETVVAYRGGDQPNNALSLGVMQPGQVASTAGTSGVVYGINNTFSHDPLSRVNCFAHINHTASDPRVGVMVCVNGTGILNAWVKRNVCAPDTSYEEMNLLAAQAPVGAHGVSILPFGNGAERILGNKCPGCQIKGIDFNRTHRSHIIRAAQEGIVFSLQYGMEIMAGLGIDIKSIHAAHANMYLSPIFTQTMASVSGAEVRLYDTDGGVGAALGAAIGIGYFADYRQACANLRQVGIVQPAADRAPYLEAYARWKDFLASTLSLH